MRNTIRLSSLFSVGSQCGAGRRARPQGLPSSHLESVFDLCAHLLPVSKTCRILTKKILQVIRSMCLPNVNFNIVYIIHRIYVIYNIMCNMEYKIVYNAQITHGFQKT